MPSILIADSSKPSVVMTSEIFKDKVPGVTIMVADSGKSALEMLAEDQPDLCVVDFDLPDVDGPALIESIRKNFSGPILLTAYPDAIVSEAVDENLFTCTDASDWIAKPVDVVKVCSAIEKFLLDGHRVDRRFVVDIDTQLVAKAAGRGKRAPKVSGNIVNMSVGGVCVKLDGTLKLKKQQELTMTLSFPEAGKSSTTKPKSKKTASKKKAAPKPSIKAVSDAKVKATVAWVSSGSVGISFGRLSDIQKRGLLGYLKNCESLDP